MKTDKPTFVSVKPVIDIVRYAKLNDLMPLLEPIAYHNNWKLNRVSDFKKAVKTFENCLLNDIGFLGWDKVNWTKLAEVKGYHRANFSDFKMDNTLLGKFLEVRSKNIYNIEK